MSQLAINNLTFAQFDNMDFDKLDNLLLNYTPVWAVAAAEIAVQGQEPHRNVFRDGNVTNLARITGTAGLPIVQDQFDLGSGSSSSSGEDARAHYTLYLLDNQDSDNRTPVAGHDGVALDVASIIFDTLQTDDRWTEDDTGYNFRHTIEIDTSSAFDVAGRSYQVEYVLTPTGEQPVIVRFQLLAK